MKHLLHPMYELACAAHEKTINQMEDILEIFNYEIKEIHSTNRDTQNYIGSCHKESEICAVYPEQRTTHLENVVNINVDSDSVIPQEKKKGIEKYC